MSRLARWWRFPRLCQYCARPLGRFAKILHVYTCKDCAARMSMGGGPTRRRYP